MLYYTGKVTATLSSQYHGRNDYGPNKAIDGVTTNEWKSMVVTLGETSPWIQLEFTTNYCIHSVKIFDRAFGDDRGYIIES